VGREVDLFGRGLYMRRGKTERLQVYINVISEALYVRQDFRFVEVVRRGNVYIEKGA
jgi:hypothetical protein